MVSIQMFLVKIIVLCSIIVIKVVPVMRSKIWVWFPVRGRITFTLIRDLGDPLCDIPRNATAVSRALAVIYLCVHLQEMLDLAVAYNKVCNCYGFSRKDLKLFSVYLGTGRRK